MIWKLHIAKSAVKKLRRLPQKDSERIAIVLREFVSDPYFGDIEKIEGETSAWRRRVGNYRILYEINGIDKLISVRDIRRRTSKTY